MFCILTDSGRRSTLTRSPSSKPSGTLFCINKGMFRFRTFSGWEPFCHCSSCLRESRNEGTVPLDNHTIYSGNKRQIPKVLTFNEFFDSLRVNRIIVLGLCFPISLLLSLFVPAVLHNQRDDELFRLFWLFWTAAEFRRRISTTPKGKLNTLCTDNPDGSTTTSIVIIVNFSINQTISVTTVSISMRLTFEVDVCQFWLSIPFHLYLKI